MVQKEKARSRNISADVEGNSAPSWIKAHGFLNIRRGRIRLSENSLESKRIKVSKCFSGMC